MIRKEHQCVDCCKPCLGSTCPNFSVTIFECDKCKCEVDELYVFEGEQICTNCLLDNFEKVGDDEEPFEEYGE